MRESHRVLGDSLRRRHQPPDPESRESGRRKRGSGRNGRFGLRHWILAALIILLGSFGVGYLISTQILFPRPETAGTGIPVPELYGLARADAEQRIEDVGLVVGSVSELASSQAEPGQVLAQDPVPGQQLRSGAAVSFAVSSGPPEVRVPPLRGLAADAARDLLARTALDVEVAQVRTAEVPAGAVADTEPAAGTLVQLPGSVTIIISVGPPPVDTVPPAPPLGEM